MYGLEFLTLNSGRVVLPNTFRDTYRKLRTAFARETTNAPLIMSVFDLVQGNEPWNMNSLVQVGWADEAGNVFPENLSIIKACVTGNSLETLRLEKWMDVVTYPTKKDHIELYGELLVFMLGL